MKKKFLAILAALGYTEKAKTPEQFSAEELKALDKKCQEEFKLSFADTLGKILLENQESQEVIELTEENKSTLVALFGTEEKPAGKNVAEEITNLKNKVTQLEGEQEDSTPKKVTAKVVKVAFAHSKTHLFGAELPIFGLEKPWNAVMKHKKTLEDLAPFIGLSNDWTEHQESFNKDFKSYTNSLAKRIGELHASGELAQITMQGIDFSGFEGTGWGEQYLVRRQDALIAYIRQLPRLTMFPVRYGVQDKETVTNSFFSEFSSPWISGRAFKGDVSVQPQLAEVFDVMLKHKFSDLKKLEREYIGYLNREGSDPIKWTWIEWVVVRIMTILQNEQNNRRVKGYRCEPKNGVPGSYLTGSNGLFRQLRIWAYEEFRIQPFSDFGVYTATTILDTIEGFVEKANQIPGISLDGYVLYFNDKHINWYLKAYRKAYGVDQDFKGPSLSIENFPNVKLIPVPNMGTSCMLILTMPGNIEFLENVPGEMAKLYFQQDMDELMIRSVWKEGTSGIVVGKQYESAVARDADNYKYQFIFINEPISELTAGATTIDGNKNDWFKTVANAGATVISDITGAEYGRVYRIICGHMTNASKITKENKFSQITADWTPGAVGDFIEVYLYKNPNDTEDANNNKFIEVKRKVTA